MRPHHPRRAAPTPRRLAALRTLSAAILASLLVACGDDDLPADGGMADGAMDTGVDAQPDTAPPTVDVTPPASPVLTPCADGFTEVPGVDGAPATCAPFGGAPMPTCADGERRDVGSASCVRVGSACPAGDFPDDLPDDGTVVYVRPGATGAGTRGDPMGDLAAALAATPEGGTLALAVGRYPPLRFRVERSITVRGACTDTVLDDIVLSAGADDVRAQDLRFEGGQVFTTGAAMRLDGVIIVADDAPAIVHSAGTLSASDVLMIAPLSKGLESSSAGGAVLRDTEIREGLGGSIFVTRGDLLLERVVLDDSDPGPDPEAQLFLADGSSATMRTSVASRRLTLFGASSLRVEDSLLAGSAREGVPDPGILLIGAGDVSLERVTLLAFTEFGVAVAEDGSLSMRDVIVRDIGTGGSMGSGHGIEISDRATAVLERVHVTRASRVGLLVDGAGTTVTGSDVVVTEMEPDSTGTLGRAMQVQREAEVMLDRVHVDRALEAGVVVSTMAAATLTNLRVTETLPRACVETGCSPGGVGIGAYASGALDVSHFSLSNHTLVGAQVAQDGLLSLRDGEVFANPVGANVQVVDYDLDLLTDRVIYRDNGANLDSELLFVPDPTPP